jgi:GH15 family glucan-1,4-alpha-glucosidase
LTHAKSDTTVRRSVEAILRNQKENGAIVASPDFSQYGFCWLRDASFSSYALDRGGEYVASNRYHVWVNGALSGIAELIDNVIAAHERGEKMDPLGMPPARFALDGTTVVDDWPNFQLDGYGTWLWTLGQHLELSGESGLPATFEDSVRRVARYLSTFALSPCYDVWEENGDAQHMSTLACVYGGLVTAGRLLGDESYVRRAEEVRARVREIGSQNGYYLKSTTNNDVDASSIWLSVPFGLTSPAEPDFAATVALIVDRLTFIGGIRRYRTDVFFGSGAWPVLTGFLGWHYVSLGDRESAARCLGWIESHFTEEGLLAEQYGGEQRDPVHYHEWVERWGLPAQDLMWSHAMFVVLSRELEESSNGATSLSSSEPEVGAK